MQYRFYLDGNLITENPLGWDAMTVDIVRDNDLKGVFVKVVADLTFTSDGHDYIKGIYDSSDYCSVITISVHRSVDNGANFIERYKGLLYLSDMIFDEFNCSVKTKFTDDSFYGKIDNRRTTEAYPTGTRTINSEDDNIIPPPIYSMSLFDPSTGVYLGTTQTNGIYKVYDVLQYLVGFMTDNEVDFDSPVFGPSGDFANLGLTYGFSIRATGNGNDLTLGEFTQEMPPITFATLFKELNNRLNLGMFIDTTGPRPKIIIDYWQELFISNDVTTFPNLPNLKTSIAREHIYTNIKFGGSKVLDLIAASFPETIRFLGFNAEQFLIVGKCNLDNTLDLSYNYVSSSNVIEQIAVLSGTDETYDRDWFLINCTMTGLGTMMATQSNWLSPLAATPLYYNEALANFNIAKRYLGFVPNSIASFLGNGDDMFLASQTAPQQFTLLNTFTRILFQDDTTRPNFDTNGNYDTALSEYTIPNSGVYTFEGRGDYRAGASAPIVSRLYISHYDSLMNLIQRYEIFSAFTNNTTTYPFSGSATINASTGDIILVEGAFIVITTAVAYPIISNATFSCTNTTNGGGEYQTYEPQDYPIIQNEFTTEIFDSQTDAIVAAPLSKLAFYVDPALQKSAWIDDVSINEFTGIITAKVLSSRTQEPELPPVILQQVHFVGSLEDIPFVLDRADEYGNPTAGNSFINRVLFYRAGSTLTVTIPATHQSAPAGTPCIIIGEQNATTTNVYNFNTTTVTFTIQSGFDYNVRFRYVMNDPGNTFFQAVPQITAPPTAGVNGTATIGLILPASAADYTFLWSTGATTQGISAPAGDYTCQVTYVPGTFDTNVLTFFIQIPISETGA